MISKKGSDAKYFATTTKGEIPEWKNDLNSLNKDKIKDAVKKVIAAMTVGQDVSTLFTDVIKGMQTDNIELKKLVYLYIINYARSTPDKAILIVNTFQRDAVDKSPLLRALAIRTMGCIRVDRITEYLAEPLAKGLKDKDPYVRKTSAVCVAKLYDINRELVEEQGFLDVLREMVSDSNQMVVANAVAALAEISEASGRDIFQINKSMLQKLTFALNECTEWGQVFILDCLAKYEPNAKDAQEIIERVSPRLKHANSAVAMSAVKVIMKYMMYIDNKEQEKLLVSEKLPPPLITLLSEQRPEIQYVALRNINLIVQKQPNILAGGVKHFFCKYNDPIYVKMEKLEIMVKIANAKNIDKVLLELKEYASEVDVDFVRKAVSAIGRCAIKLDSAAERCVNVLLELIQSKVNYVVQEAVIVIKDIFRKYPNKYERIISTLCENLENLDEPDAKSAMIWIIGEYAARIDNAHDLLESFLDQFHDESPQVQLQLLTAIVKLCLVRPSQNKGLVEQVLEMATQNSDNPDLRDRGYIYWRLLSTNPEAARQVVCAEKPTISDETFQLEPSVLDVLIGHISSLASVYHKPPEYFIKDAKSVSLKSERKRKEEEEEEEDASVHQEDDDEEDDDGHTPSPAPAADSKASAPFDLFGLDFDAGGSQPEGHIVLTGKGLQLRTTYTRNNGVPTVNFTVENQSKQNLTTFKLKFRENQLGVAPSAPLDVGVLAPGSWKTCSIPLAVSDKQTDVNKPVIDIAIKTELPGEVFYFNDTPPVDILFQEDGKLDAQRFLALFKALVAKERVSNINFSESQAPLLQSKLESIRVFHIASRSNQELGQVKYFSVRFRDTSVLFEITLKGNSSKICIRPEREDYGHIILPYLAKWISGGFKAMR